MFKKKIDDNIQTELRQIQESRQKLMKCVLNTRQRNISLQLYGDDLTPVITNEKVNRQNEKEKNEQQLLLDSIKKQYTQRSPMGNAYCGLKALRKCQQSKLFNKLL
ncbi:unnamed protein product [Paramecium octaurelia]|uniref:Uncharacterized protein n=1 Tax=Paramecium octaurelia TaxID=43137 RepID=A0A8S1VZY7_PAROT|nr:unnamed protein product [Paramecium octaurelia]